MAKSKTKYLSWLPAIGITAAAAVGINIVTKPVFPDVLTHICKSFYLAAGETLGIILFAGAVIYIAGKRNKGINATLLISISLLVALAYFLLSDNSSTSYGFLAARCKFYPF